ncbi:MAG: D-galactonate dehydratase [Candidatus Moanabacter tarae]|uniref:D-galactonate dehydratase n=1 Tax=Candidatus Moanibacter tarae TaxID=2200854 RepID=A0A2Z4AG98_9BACT|nr:MAG: D-galactonate dehydratase [Candidatus Moanabacter tarae]|tara:strand:+ start:2066 stop:3274 length:1209 start_codon:yes stop_codon:yes gene_type:complete
MKVTKIETIRVAEQPHIIWVQLHTDTGLIGLGETWYAPTVVETAIHDWFGPLVIGRDPASIERHWEAMFRLSDHAGYGGAEMRAISAIDIALWDLKGQVAGLPIYELLGGAVRKKIRVYATGMPYEGAADLARALLDEGIVAMKGGPTIPLAIASDGQFLSPKELDLSLKPIREIRDSMGTDMQIANDAHGKWALPVAIRIAQAMDPYEMMWQEDLMPLLNPEALSRLQAATEAPVCISERLLTRWQLRHFIENGSARIVMPDLIWTGGISETYKIVILASAHQVPFAPHDASGPVNIFACSHICYCSTNAMMQEHVPANFKGWYGKFVDPNLDIREGFLHASENPGIGTRLKTNVRDRSDASIRVSDTPGKSLIDTWGPAPQRTAENQTRVDELEIERGPQ